MKRARDFVDRTTVRISTAAREESDLQWRENKLGVIAAGLFLFFCGLATVVQF